MLWLHCKIASSFLLPYDLGWQKATPVGMPITKNCPWSTALYEQILSPVASPENHKPIQYNISLYNRDALSVSGSRESLETHLGSRLGLVSDILAKVSVSSRSRKWRSRYRSRGSWSRKSRHSPRNLMQSDKNKHICIAPFHNQNKF